MTERAGLRYLVTGSRDFGNWSVVRRVCAALQPGSTVIHGDARGADTMVQMVLTQNAPQRARRVRVHGSDGTIGPRRGGRRKGDIDIDIYPADWDRYTPSRDTERKNPAGVIRNGLMLSDATPDRCIYFADDLSTSDGTRHMVELCEKAEVPIWDAEDFVRFMRTEGERDG